MTTSEPIQGQYADPAKLRGAVQAVEVAGAHLLFTILPDEGHVQLIGVPFAMAGELTRLLNEALAGQRIDLTTFEAGR